MTEQSKEPRNPPAGNQHPKVYSVSQDKDGSFHFTRRDLLYVSAAIGGTLLLRGVCPRFGAKSAHSGPVQSGMSSLPKVYLHTGPSIASNIADTLQHNDFVRLISDHPDLGWVEVATRGGQQGWVKRSSVDFSRAIKSSSPSFDLSSAPAPTPTQTEQPRPLSLQLHVGDRPPKRAVEAGKPYPCGDVIQNGDFEAGSDSWLEESTGEIIRNDWSDPYQGSWVAWFGGLDTVEKLRQLFVVPDDVQDAQTLEFYIQVTTEETSDQRLDTLLLGFITEGGSQLGPTVLVADNITPTDWVRISIDVSGMAEHAGESMALLFEAHFDPANITHFVIDSVSLDMMCEEPVYYAYLPIVVREPTPTHTPTATPTSTPTPSPTPCPSYSACPSHKPCPSYCSSDCTSHCSTDCSSQCPLDCVFDCLDCVCIGYWCSYN
jgi:uncharacterized protein YgiM (DUF1202 family)